MALMLSVGHARTAPDPTAHVAPAIAATTLPAEAFFKRPQVESVQLSPSGKRIAVATAAQTGRVSLYVIELNPLGQAKVAASFRDADVRRFDWVNDDRLVFDTVNLQAGSGESYRVAPGLFSVMADGSGLRVLVSRHGLAVTSGRQSVEPLSWNHSLLHVPPQADGSASEEVVIGKDVRQGNDLLAVVPMWLNVRTGRTRSMDVKAPGDAVRWWFNSAGEPLAVQTRREGRDTVHWRASVQSDWRKLTEGPVFDLPFVPLLASDDGTLYVTHAAGPAGFRVVKRFDFARNAPEKDALVSTPGFDFSGSFLRDVAGGPVLGVRLNVDAETTVWFDPPHKALQAVADAALPGRVNRISCRQCDKPEGVMLVNSWSDRHPGELLLYRVGPKAWERVAQAQPGIDSTQMGEVNLHRIKARDDRDLPVWVTTPAGHHKGQQHPAVVLVHGGPWVRGGHWRWNPMTQFLASRGYVVIEPEFRGSTGYGDAHLKASWKQYGLSMQDDVADALLWARQQGLVGDRACIAGASYGGYSTLMGLAKHPELYRCGIAWVALTDLMLYVKGSWWINDDISTTGRRYSLIERVGDPDNEKDRALLIAQSPINQADKITAPVMLAFGEADLRVPLAHGKRMREALQKAGNEPEWIVYPGEGHGWRLTANQVDFAQRMERFLAKHLAASPAAATAKP